MAITSQRVRDVAANHEAALAFGITTAVFLVLHQLMAVVQFPADAGGYWDISDPAVLTHYPMNIRGYFWPALLSPAHLLSHLMSTSSQPHGVLSYRIISSLAYALVLTVGLPRFYTDLFGGRVSLSRRLFVPLVLVVLAPGLVIYPLSDLPAFLLLLAALHLVSRFLEDASRPRWLLLVFAGVLAGGSYYSRPVYLASVVLLAPVVFFICRRKSVGLGALAAAAFIAGLFLVALPQIRINQTTGRGPTPGVSTTAPGYTKGVYAYQLWDGIRAQRYETMVAEGDVRAVFFLDPSGMDLWRSENLKDATQDVATYLRLAAQYPVTIAGTWTRHLVNGADMRFGTVYLRDPTRDTTPQSAMNYLLLFIAAWVAVLSYRVAEEERRPEMSETDSSAARASSHWATWLVLLLLPVLASIPGHMESRFFLPLLLVAWSTIAYRASWRGLLADFRAHPVVVSGLYVATYVVFYLTTRATMANVYVPGP